jgi:hypothetical protein
MLQQNRPPASNVAVVSFLRNKNGGETLDEKEGEKIWFDTSQHNCASLGFIGMILGVSSHNFFDISNRLTV